MTARNIKLLGLAVQFEREYSHLRRAFTRLPAGQTLRAGPLRYGALDATEPSSCVWKKIFMDGAPLDCGNQYSFTSQELASGQQGY